MSKKSLVIKITVILLALAVSVWGFPKTVAWIKAQNNARAAYDASHHDACTDIQTIVQVAPDAGSFGHTDGFNVWGDKGGWKLVVGYPAPGIGVQFCFGSYISVPN